MNYCFKCGIGEDRAFLFDAVSQEGVVQICRKCSFDEDIPLIKKQSLTQRHNDQDLGLKTDLPAVDSSGNRSVYDRLSRMSAAASNMNKIQKTSELKKQESNLKELVETNFERKIVIDGKPRKDLIDNFHWIIMRARRFKKISQKQLAMSIAESEESIRQAEKGFILQGSDNFVRKLEDFLNIKILKKTLDSMQTSDISYSLGEDKDSSESSGKFALDGITSKGLTISDLQEMERKKEDITFKDEEDDLLIADEDAGEDEFEFGMDKKDILSQEEINDLIFNKD